MIRMAGREAGTPDYVSTTKQSYDSGADAYIGATRSFSAFPGLREEVEEFASLVGDGPFLEVGVGSGRDLTVFRGQVAHLIASDISFELLTRLGASVARVQLDARRLPFPPDLFRAVWCWAVLVHLRREDARRALLEIRRVLAKQGWAGVSVKLGEGEGYQQGTSLPGVRWFTLFSREEFEEMVSSAGLQIKKSRIRAERHNQWLSVFAQRSP